jgi:hypothetical protein
MAWLMLLSTTRDEESMSIRPIAVMGHMTSLPVVQVILGQTYFIKTTCLSILRERSPLVPEVQAIEVPLC